MIRCRPLAFVIGIVLLAALGILTWRFFFVRETWKPTGPLTQEAYVWQRRWNKDVRESVTRSQELLDGLCVEVAEMSRRNGKIEVANAAVDWSALASLRKPVGLAWRIGAPVIAKGWTDEVRAEIGRMIFDSLAKARQKGIAISKAQIDCDCPTRLLGEYAEFMESLRAKDGGVRWTLTALPSWLHSAEFMRLAKASDGFVLQVHWLRPDPFSPGKATLMISSETRDAVAQSPLGIQRRLSWSRCREMWLKICSKGETPLLLPSHLPHGDECDVVRLRLAAHECVNRATDGIHHRFGAVCCGLGQGLLDAVFPE